MQMISWHGRKLRKTSRENQPNNCILNFLENHLLTLLEDVSLQTRQKMIFNMTEFLHIFVKPFRSIKIINNWIGPCGPINWPPRSPDLATIIWGTIWKHSLWKKVTTKEEFVARIFNAVEILQS